MLCECTWLARIKAGPQGAAEIEPRVNIHCMYVIYQTREGVFQSDIKTLGSRLKKRGVAEFFLNDFEVSTVVQ